MLIPLVNFYVWFFGLQGATGEPGDEGMQGETGIVGAQGAKGDRGRAGAAGQQVSYTSEYLFMFALVHLARFVCLLYMRSI